MVQPTFRPKRKPDLYGTGAGLRPFRRDPAGVKLSPGKTADKGIPCRKNPFLFKKYRRGAAASAACPERGRNGRNSGRKRISVYGRPGSGSSIPDGSAGATAEGQEEGFVLKQRKERGFICFPDERKGTPVYWKDNYFTLLPGEEKKLTGEGDWKPLSCRP